MNIRLSDLILDHRTDDLHSVTDPTPARFPAVAAQDLAVLEAQYDGAIDRVLHSLSGVAARCARERAEASGLLLELEAQPPLRQRLLIHNRRFHTWGLLTALLERSRAEAFLEPRRGEHWAELAIEQAEHLDLALYQPALIADMKGRALSYLGNARRMRSDLSGAEEAFSRAAVQLRRGSRQPMERALLHELKASLRTDQRRFEEAMHLLRRAIDIFDELGEQHRAGRCMVQMSTVLDYAGLPERSIPLLFAALPLIDAEREPRLLLCARHNLIEYLTESGRLLEAEVLLAESWSLYARFPEPWARDRRRWVQGKVAHGLGRFAEAESELLAARDGFVASGVAYDAALVSLHLASLYAQQGRTGDLRQLVREMLPIFVSRQIHQEALAALAFFRQAVEMEAATLHLVSSVAGYLRRAQHDSGLRFEAPH
ncbi:MAG TPA: hypothetical protein VGE98_09660 [Thermoanaerobaculia bacterium]